VNTSFALTSSKAVLRPLGMPVPRPSAGPVSAAHCPMRTSVSVIPPSVVVAGPATIPTAEIAAAGSAR